MRVLRTITLPSGTAVEEPLERLLASCTEEYRYYDAIPTVAPNAIEPLDVLVTVAVNSFITNAAQARSIHRGLAAACDPILATIPEHADLLSFDPELEMVEGLLHAACSVPKVLVPVATKVLHRKRRRLISMFDSVLIDHYLAVLGRLDLRGATQDKRKAARVAAIALRPFREDLLAVSDELAALAAELGTHGYLLTPLRILEILTWTEFEPRSYYRAPAP